MMHSTSARLHSPEIARRPPVAARSLLRAERWVLLPVRSAATALPFKAARFTTVARQSLHFRGWPETLRLSAPQFFQLTQILQRTTTGGVATRVRERLTFGTRPALSHP